MSTRVSIADHAAGVIDNYLTAVQRHMLVAVKPGRKSAEAVHQTRVFARRANASLEVYQQWLPNRQMQWFRKQLTRIRRVAGKLRDLDVLLERYADPSDTDQKQLKRLQLILPELRQKRLERVNELVSLQRRLTVDNKFARRQSALILQLKRRCNQEGSDEQYQVFARLKLKATANKFVSCGTAPLDSLEAIHQFRICAKKLRYTLEVLADAFPRDLVDEIHERVVRLQDLLGQINDCSLARHRLRKWSAKCHRKKLTRQLKSQRVIERQRQASLLKKLASDWNSDNIHRFQKMMEKLMPVSCTTES